MNALARDYSQAPELLTRLRLAAPELLSLSPRVVCDSNALEPWSVAEAPAYPLGVLVFHSLSPLGDTAFLLASLGQARRVAAILELPLTVALADSDVARHNRIVCLFGADALSQNRAWRLELYSAIGATTLLASLKNLPGVPEASLRERADWVEAQARRSSVAEEPSLEGRVRGELYACLNAHFRIADWRTALYFLAQRQHQQRFAGYLKLGNPRERHFDQPAHRLDLVEYGVSRGVDRALYVADYAMGRSSRTAVTLHAYCFPSGTAFDRSRSVDFCRKLALHLGDLGHPGRAREAFTALRPPHDARFLADLLSFIHFWSVERGEPASPDIREALRSATPEWGSSWSHYCVDATLFGARAREWLACSSARKSGGPPPPYYVFPFLFEAAPRRSLVHQVLLAAERWLASHLPNLPAFSGATLPIARQGLDAGEGTPALLAARAF